MTKPMRDARRIRDDRELRELNSRGLGFVIDPFNRRWHTAACSRVGPMTLGEPKWFAADRLALRVYLEQRQASYPTAKPIDPCPRCVGGASPSTQPAPSTASPAPAVRAPHVEATSNRHHLVYPTASRITFAPKRGTVQHAVLGDLRTRLQGLALRDGEKLHAVFAGPIPANSDVENYLLYNVFDSEANRLLRRGVRFELDPTPRARGVEYRYGSAPIEAGFDHWTEGVLAASWPSLPIVPGSPERLLSRVWWTLRRGSVRTIRPLRSDARFCATIRVVVPPTKLAVVARPESIKKLVDGLVAAFQRHEGSYEACARIASVLGTDAASIARQLKDRERAVLGRAELPIGRTKVGVHWHPDDTRLVGADVSFVQHDAPDWLVTGEFAEARQIN